ncbi:Bug family tripartite tricarboxylate transporter substrate binding protein [Falsiroseomonas oryzae]|uniref:Bug family tripartite tricarboxylate transporter substrate binding protein n=1 Tax=Falsiroseomonas oryzae TaxID=2766473 RepID=UPI0022EB4880|nr:tripartite tricarboxylate transporter substrate binding protein [Roseomonas sp. MO-31]
MTDQETGSRAGIGRRAALALPGLLLAGGASAQANWPEGPVRVISAGTPGGSTDVMGRLVADALAARLGRPFPVEARPGAEGVIAIQAFVQAPPGSALFLTHAGAITTTPLVMQNLTYDTWTDLVPIAPIATDFLAYAVNSRFPATTMAELFERVRANPGRHTWCSAPGATYLLTNAELRRSGLDMSFVNYRTTTAATTDTAEGRVDMAVMPLTTNLLPFVREGKLRVLAVTNAVRSPAAPETPTVAQAGFPGLEVEGFPGFCGWKGMPDALRSRISGLIQEIIQEPAIRQRLADFGMIPRPSTPERFAADLRSLHDRLAEIARTYGARPPA